MYPAAKPLYHLLQGFSNLSVYTLIGLIVAISAVGLSAGCARMTSGKSGCAAPVEALPASGSLSLIAVDPRTSAGAAAWGLDELAQLLPSAAPVAQKARSQHLLVSITGYTSPDGGSNAYNLALSAKRADAVRDRLVALGLPAKQIIQVIGAGTGGKSPDACIVNGHLDEAICAQLRRVVVVLSPAKANP